MRFALIISLVLFCTVGVRAQVFPDMHLQTSDGHDFLLPRDAQGKFTLIGLAYSQKSEKALKTWFLPVYYKFIQEQTGFMEGLGYDVNVYFIPMFTGINVAVTDFARNMTLKKLDAELIPHVLFYKGKIDAYKEILGMSEKNIPYFFVLNAEGNIIHNTSGSYQEDKMDDIESVIE